MPYRIMKRGSKFTVQSKAGGTWHTKATHTTRAKAESQIRLLRGLEHGMKKK